MWYSEKLVWDLRLQRLDMNLIFIIFILLHQCAQIFESDCWQEMCLSSNLSICFKACKDLVISTPNLLLDLTIQKDEDNYTSDHHTFIQLHHKIHHSYNLHPYLSPVHRELGNLHSRTQASRNWIPKTQKYTHLGKTADRNNN